MKRFLTYSALLLIGSAAAMAAPPAAPVQSYSGLTLEKTSFLKLPGWQDDAHDEALATFQRSCTRLNSLSPSQQYGMDPLRTEASVWQKICEEADQLMANDRIGARSFFERKFVPYRVGMGGDFTGKFTGYFEPLARGSWKQKPGYAPVYATPPDLVSGQTYPLSRGQIMDGALSGKNLELMWMQDPVDLFFLQVQGSGRVVMDTGETVALRFAGKNNQPYTAIGKVLVEQGAIPQGQVTAPAIRSWLHANPGQAPGVMARNASYIFFSVSKDVDSGPVGAQNVSLTPERSLAIDTTFIPLGMPLFLQTTLPETPVTRAGPYQRLMIAQDKGSAINGAIRGDVFFGFGERAEALAGTMNQEGGYVALVPEALARKLDGKKF